MLAAILLAAATPAPPTPLWLDWTKLTRAAPAKDKSVAGAQALGERIGRMVAAGDCRGGEKLALDAGDLRLAAAVRKYCNT